MSKEASQGMVCPGCNQLIAYPEYHAPHCKPMQQLLARASKGK